MILLVKGMKCIHCVNRVKTALEQLGGVNVVVSLENSTATFENVDAKLAISTIKDLGFKATVSRP